MNLSPFYIIAVEAAVKAGIAVKQIYQTLDYKIEIKSDESPVTIADRTSSGIIARMLSETGILIIDEEQSCPDFTIRKSLKNLWMVDPMDGTKEFISGNGEFTINIALLEDFRPKFGVIYAPVSGMLYWGGEVTGSFKAGNVFEWKDFSELKAVSLNPQVNISKKLRLAASRSHLDDNTRKFISRIEAQFGEIEFVSKGSSLKLCMIAEGITDMYPRFSRTMEWDTAAGHAIVAGTGGVLLQARSLQELQYNKEDLSNPPFFALSGIQKQKRINYFSLLSG